MAWKCVFGSSHSTVKSFPFHLPASMGDDIDDDADDSDNDDEIGRREKETSACAATILREYMDGESINYLSAESIGQMHVDIFPISFGCDRVALQCRCLLAKKPIAMGTAKIWILECFDTVTTTATTASIAPLSGYLTRVCCKHILLSSAEVHGVSPVWHAAVYAHTTFGKHDSYRNLCQCLLCRRAAQVRCAR